MCRGNLRAGEVYRENRKRAERQGSAATLEFATYRGRQNSASEDKKTAPSPKKYLKRGGVSYYFYSIKRI